METKDVSETVCQFRLACQSTTNYSGLPLSRLTVRYRAASAVYAHHYPARCRPISSDTTRHRFRQQPTLIRDASPRRVASHIDYFRLTSCEVFSVQDCEKYGAALRRNMYTRRKTAMQTGTQLSTTEDSLYDIFLFTRFLFVQFRTYWPAVTHSHHP